MKRQHVFILLSLVGALAVAFSLMKSPKNSGAEVPADEVADTTPPEKEETVKDKTDLGQVVDTPVAVPTEPVARPTATAEPDSETPSDEAVPPEQVASTIKKNLAGARKILQQKAAIEKAKPEDVHHMPRETLDAAKRLGEIAELEAQHPEQAETFRDFYLECPRDDNTITVTRAQCLDKYMKASKMDAAAQKQFLSEFPEEITRLVEALQ